MSKYDIPMVDSIDTIPGKIMSRIRQGSNVLEFGCANGRMTKYMQQRLQCKVFIVEIDREAFDVAVQYAEDGFCGDIEQFEWVNKAAQNKFDYIIFADVLEHLKEPEKVIDQAANLLKEDGEIVISIPNIAHFDILANLYLNHFKYTKIGLLDDTHIHFWGKEDLQDFFTKRSLSVTVIDGVYVDPYCTEQAVEKGLLPSDVEVALLKKENSDLYQFFIVVQKKEWVKKENVKTEDKLKNSWLLRENLAHLYWDFGEGYYVGDCVLVFPDIVTNGTCFVYRFDKIPKGCIKIRFDLPMGDYCTATDVSVLTEKGVIDVRALNGVLLDNVFIFTDLNPQLEIDIPSDIQWIEIRADVRRGRDVQSAYFYTLLQNVPNWRSISERFGSVELELTNKNKLLEDVSFSLDEARAALKQAMSDLHNTQEQLFDTKGELSCAKTELEKANAKAKLIQEEMNDKEKDINDIRLELDKKTQELNVALQDAESAKAKIESILNEKNEQERILNDTIQQATARTAEQEEQIRQLRNELQQSIDYGHHMENVYHQLSEQHNVVVTSQSWRITYPMRRFLDLLKRSRFFMLIWKTMRSLKFNGFRKTCKKIFNYIFRRNKDGTPELIEEYVIPVDSVKNPLAFFAHKAKKNALFSEAYAIDTMKEYDESKGKKILLVSHELDLTGAPVAIFHFARILKNEGYCPVVISPHSGNLAKSFEEENIPAFVCPSVYEGDAVKQYSDLFDLVVASTIVSAPVVSVFNGTNMPVLWWIHEAEASYTELFEGRMPKILADNVFVRVGGEHAARLLKKHRCNYKIEQMLYYVPDFTKEDKKKYKKEDAFALPDVSKGKKIFCVIGKLEYRKGQDIAVEAILQLPVDCIRQSYFVFVGSVCYPEAHTKIVQLCAMYPENTLYIQELPMVKLRQLYEQMDCLMCTSRDDPMPIVVTEALMLSKTVICSENTGSASLIEKENAGLVYTGNSKEELAQCILDVIKGEGVEEFVLNAQSVYDKYFSEEIFRQNIFSIMDSVFSTDNKIVKGELAPINIENLKIRHFVEDFEQKKEDEDYITLKDEVLNYDDGCDRKRVLLVTHECSITGAPIALKFLAKQLAEQGNQVVVISPYDGPLVEDFTANGIPTVVYKKLYSDSFIRNQAERFDLVVLSTVVTFESVKQLADCGTPVLWWIHDSRASYEVGGFKSILPPLPKNVKVFCGGEYARKQLLDYYPEYEADILLYSAPDKASIVDTLPVYKLDIDSNKIIFSVIGQQDYRKGHDVFAEAIRLLADSEREQAHFLFIGAQLDERVFEAVDSLRSDYPDSVTYIPQIPHESLFSVYKQCDCVVCSSRDDPMPVFVTEAMMMSKAVICSENTGWTTIIEQEGCGLVYYNDSAEELADKLRYIIANRDKLGEFGKLARESYVRHFRKDVFADRVQQIVSDMDKLDSKFDFEGTVSIVIPTYNAGDAFEPLLNKLLAQKRVRGIEIVIVDSGSTDGTVEYCEKYGVNLIKIPNKEFSHSYARNLGAINSCGEILLFMTQDASPIDENWLYDMIQPIVDCEAAAVSCNEHCTKEIDLYYRCSSVVFAKFRGIYNEDQLNVFDSSDDWIRLRQKASLSDVASAIRRDVFARYLYRYNYAEDLDMGIRLLKDGYPIKLIKATSVVHGHNRAAGYYMKRGLVEVIAMEKIMEDSKQPIEQDFSIARKIVYGSKMIAYLDNLNRAEIKEECKTERFFSLIGNNIQKMYAQDSTVMEQTEPLFSQDLLLRWCVDKVAPWAQMSVPNEQELVQHVMHYLEHILRPFVEKENPVSVDLETQNAVCSCLEKQFCLLVGTLLARADRNLELYQSISSLAEGV